MCILLMILLGFWTDVSNADPGCEIRADAECRLSSVLPLEIPESEADLQLVCTNMERVKKCLVDFLENCTEESSTQIIINEDIPDFEKYQLELKLNQEQQRLKENKQILDIATELCRENSQLRQDFILDMACFKRVIENEDDDYTCQETLMEVFEYLGGRNDVTLEEWKGAHYQCLDSIFNINCYLTKFSNRCSSRAIATALEMIRRGGNLEEQCPSSIRTFMSGLLKDLKLVLDGKIYVEKLLEDDI